MGGNIIETIKLKIKGRLKTFLLLTGGSAVGFLVSVKLHNLIYALGIIIFGEGIWGGGDEAFFFIVTLFVCPLLFLIGMIGTLILFLKEK